MGTHLWRWHPPCPRRTHRQHLLDFVTATLACRWGVLHRPVPILEEVHNGLGNGGSSPLLLPCQAWRVSAKEKHQGWDHWRGPGLSYCLKSTGSFCNNHKHKPTPHHLQRMGIASFDYLISQKPQKLQHCFIDKENRTWTGPKCS